MFIAAVGGCTGVFWEDAGAVAVGEGGGGGCDGRGMLAMFLMIMVVLASSGLGWREGMVVEEVIGVGVLCPVCGSGMELILSCWSPNEAVFLCPSFAELLGFSITLKTTIGKPYVIYRYTEHNTVINIIREYFTYFHLIK